MDIGGASWKGCMEYWYFGVSGNVGITGLAWSAIQGMHSSEEELFFVHVEFTV